jgi:hypothetical protein
MVERFCFFGKRKSGVLGNAKVGYWETQKWGIDFLVFCFGKRKSGVLGNNFKKMLLFKKCCGII